jgi:hypothetical protein
MRLTAIILWIASIAFGATPPGSFGVDLLRSVPLRFEPVNAGGYQWVARGSTYAVAFGARDTLIAAEDHRIRLTLEGSQATAKFEASLPAATQYFRGRSPRAAVAYSRLRRVGVYPGVDLVYYANGADLEYDFEIAPGADPSVIAMRFEGADSVRLTPDGDILLQLGAARITQKLPVVYQRVSTNEVESVPAAYRLGDQGTIRLDLGAYDAGRPLVVDPTLQVAAFFPGTGGDGVVAIAKDAKGFLYMAGYTYSTDFALVGDSFNVFLRNRDGWVMKLDPNANLSDIIVYSTFFGGSATEDIKAMTVDSAGIVYLAGTTDSVDFPLTTGGYIATWGGGIKRTFVSVLDTKAGMDGLLYSTIFGGTSGNDEPTGIAVAGGKIYVTGFSTSDDFPVVNPVQSTRGGGYDAFLAQFDPGASGTASLLFSTYLGGTAQDVSRSLAVDAAGKVYIAGYTYSGDFTTTPGAYRTSYQGGGDIFLTRIDPSAANIEYSTYIGGSGLDQAKKILLDPQGRVVITGYTLSNNLQITQNALQPVNNGSGDVFLMIFDPSAQPGAAIAYSTYFGGSDGDVPYDLRRDASGRYYICGYTLSQDFPVRNALNPNSAGGGVDGFVAVINPSAAINNQLVYSSYLTGSGTQIAYALEVDSSGTVYVAGDATAGIFPAGASAPVVPSNTNVFLMGFQPLP